ncbi:hypothetical protein DSL72_001053 [Monilinia vaccinii-corymbosi]|uniref:2EXR domain-containing protein n=1 Tax=Monilinia vaccinii-corymbosi TaxID=61207 RepID=A0A8A3P901_9HELO|nr:hypothetical protein DSL72_001053 [Monilinia vaccinii-corymbosi]
MKIISPRRKRDTYTNRPEGLKDPCGLLQLHVKLDIISKWSNQLFDIILKKHRGHRDYDGIIELIHGLDLSELRAFLVRGLACRNLPEYRDLKYPQIGSKPTAPLEVGDRTFPSFKRLPVELRLDIWEYVFAEDLLPKVHHLNSTDRHTGRITDSATSHLPFSNIVHVCRESREWYLSRTHNTWAFGTYVNFQSDIIYLTQQIEESTLLYKNLLSNPHMMNVQNLAMRRTSLTDNPQKTFTHIEAFANMRENLPSLKNIYVVMNEIRKSTIIDQDRDIRFKHLSARQKRKWIDVGYARKWLRWLSEKMTERGYRSVDPHFVMVGTKCEDILSSEYGEITFERRIRDGTLELF